MCGINALLLQMYCMLISSLKLGHKESVTCTSFSCNGAYLATGDMGGLIQVWKTENQQCINRFDVDELEVSKYNVSRSFYIWHRSIVSVLLPI